MSAPRAHHPAPPSRLIGGFTLVEVLVALMVMALMAAMSWQGVSGIVRSRNNSQEQLEGALRLNTVIAQWDQDLASIQETNLIPQALSCDGASVRLTRRTPTGLQVVAWSLRPTPNGMAWIRWAGPSITTANELQDSWLRSLQLPDDDPKAIRTLTGLTDWQVHFFQGNAWANCQSTGNVIAAAIPPSGASNPTTSRVALPKGVRIILSFAPGSTRSGELTRDTLLSR